jgi:hypothetical protein
MHMRVDKARKDDLAVSIDRLGRMSRIAGVEYRSDTTPDDA